jgi:hypothetical protein
MRRARRALDGMDVTLPGAARTRSRACAGLLACSEATRAKEENVSDGHHHDIFNIAPPVPKARLGDVRPSASALLFIKHRDRIPTVLLRFA